jgi:hypothetical protein
MLGLGMKGLNIWRNLETTAMSSLLDSCNLGCMLGEGGFKMYERVKRMEILGDHFNVVFLGFLFSGK